MADDPVENLPEVDMPPGESRQKALQDLKALRESVGDETLQRMLKVVAAATKVETHADGTQSVGGEAIDPAATKVLNEVERDTDAVTSLMMELLDGSKPRAAVPRPKGLNKVETRVFDTSYTAASRISADIASRAKTDVRAMRKAYDSVVETMAAAVERGAMNADAFEATKVFFQQEMFGRPKFEGRDSEKPAEAVSAKLEDYLRRSLGVKFLHEDRSLQTQCTWVNDVNGKSGRDLANELYNARGSEALLMTFRVISMPITSRRGETKVQCYDVHDLEAHCLKELSEHDPSHRTWANLGDASESGVALEATVTNPSGLSRFFTRAELTYIGRYASKVRLVERLVRGDDPSMRLSAADVDAMISMSEKLDILNVEQEAYEHGVLGTIGSYFSYALGVVSRALEHVVATFTHLLIIRNVVCIIARLFALSYWITHLGGDTIEAALDKWVMRYFSSEASAKAKALGRAALDADPSRPRAEVDYEGVTFRPGRLYDDAVVDSRGKWLKKIVREVRLNGAKWYLAQRSGGFWGLFGYVVASYGSMLAGEALTMVAKVIFNLFTGEAHWAGRLAAKLDAIWAHPTVAQIGGFLNSMTGGLLATIGTAVTTIVGKSLRIADRLYTIAPTAVSLSVVGAAGVFFFPQVGAYFIANAGAGITTAVYYDIWNHCANVLSTLFDTTVGKLFYDPFNADAASLSTIFTLFTPHLLCEILLPKGTLAERFPYAKSACTSMAAVLTKVLKGAAMFSMVLQTLSDLAYIYSVYTTGEEPTTLFGLKWRPSRCLATWTHTGETDASGKPTTGRALVHAYLGDNASERLKTWHDESIVDSIARLDGMGSASSGFGPMYLQDFLKTYVKDGSLTDAGKALAHASLTAGTILRRRRRPTAASPKRERSPKRKAASPKRGSAKRARASPMRRRRHTSPRKWS